MYTWIIGRPGVSQPPTISEAISNVLAQPLAAWFSEAHQLPHRLFCCHVSIRYSHLTRRTRVTNQCATIKSAVESKPPKHESLISHFIQSLFLFPAFLSRKLESFYRSLTLLVPPFLLELSRKANELPFFPSLRSDPVRLRRPAKTFAPP